MRRKVAILGSTGSIGTQALDVIARHPDRFEVTALAAGRNVALLREQAERFGVRIATSADDGPAGLHRAACESGANIVLAATDGAVAFDAVFAAVERGIDIAVANKELIVAAGELFMEAAARSGSRILPVDSEHSAIFQCLVGEDPTSIAAVILTASGGPFRRASAEELQRVTVAQALAHPTWSMGTKNTIDSATLMNKGLEVIEASRLFGIPGKRLHIVVHPQSIAHGFVLFTDGSVKGQLCAPDMRVPIGYALSYPNRLPSAFLRQAPLRQAQGDTGGAAPSGSSCTASVGGPGALSSSDVILSLSKDVLGMLGGKPQDAELRYGFERPDPVRFPCVRLAYEALARGGVTPAVLSAANEIAVAAFVEGRIGFTRIPEVIEGAMERVAPRPATLQDIREADREARAVAAGLVKDIERTCC